MLPAPDAIQPSSPIAPETVPPPLKSSTTVYAASDVSSGCPQTETRSLPLSAT